jgi:hypothetical protein
VVKADVGHDNLGRARRWCWWGSGEVIGDTIHGAIKEFKPSAERKPVRVGQRRHRQGGDTRK